MRRFNKDWTIPNVANWLHRQARMGLADMRRDDGASNRRYIDSCTALHLTTGSLVMLTRDTGHHTCGWWKNPDYERCLHLSVSFRDPETGKPVARDKAASDEWVNAVFGDQSRLVWTEPPYSEAGKQNDVWHYRVFYGDVKFKLPILPRGEVYTKEFTEAGWLSWSDVQEQRRKEREDQPNND